MTAPDTSVLKPQVREHLVTQSLRIKAAVSAERLWSRVLTEADRQALGGNLKECWRKLGTAGMWMKLKRVSLPRAVLEIGHVLGFLSDQDYQWLLSEIGEEIASPAPLAGPQSGIREEIASLAPQPQWNQAQGELKFGKKIIRRIRLMKQPSQMEIILNAFQAANWANSIANPLKLGFQQLHQCLRYLNSDLQKIRFHSQAGGQTITWSPA